MKTEFFDPNKKCSCGKYHRAQLEKCLVGKGVLAQLPKVISKYGHKAFVLADENTFSAAGEDVCALLEQNGIPYSRHVFKNGVEPDEAAVGEGCLHFDRECDVLVAVGSGVLGDIGKVLAFLTKLPYIVVGTAPSMDGYASAQSSMIRDGLKVSISTCCPNVIIGDTDILKNAPIKMFQAGLGDMMAKYVSICEWRIAHLITGEYYCEQVANLVRKTLRKCIDHADGLLRRDEAAVETVFEALVLGGIAMDYAGVSRPASGGEHYFSHIWDMRSLYFGTHAELHGLQCAVATRIVAGLYEKMCQVVPDRQKALKAASEFDYAKYSEWLKTFLGTAADSMIALEQKEGKYRTEQHQKRLEVILDRFDEILEIIRAELPTEAQILTILRKIEAPATMEELGIDTSLRDVFAASKDIRDKYVLSRLVWDLGLSEEFV